MKITYVLLAIAFAVVGQNQDYYWSENKKIYLNTNLNKRYVFVNTSDTSKMAATDSLKFETIIPSDVEMKSENRKTENPVISPRNSKYFV